MEQNINQLKQLISTFIKISPESINDNTIIDKTVVQGSILIHRMYAEINDLGFNIENYTEIKTYSQLLQKINLKPIQTIQKSVLETAINEDSNFSENQFNIGIDIEQVSNFKEVDDYREDNFYKQNFSAKEISYCMLQPNILQSFAGKFAAKEAIFKANNLLKNIPLNQIQILNNEKGKPFYQNHEISISHTNENAIAVAVYGNMELPKQESKIIVSENNNKNSLIKYFTIGAFIMSLLALILVVIQFYK